MFIAAPEWDGITFMGHGSGDIGKSHLQLHCIGNDHFIIKISQVQAYMLLLRRRRQGSSLECPSALAHHTPSQASHEANLLSVAAANE